VLPAPFAVRRIFAVRIAHGNEFFAVQLWVDARQTTGSRQSASSTLGKGRSPRQTLKKRTAK
jgi:hypothetical protein